ncbi:hypothetical protein [Rhodobacter sp. NSM]|uniref:hypothetical protein n=1 Tax=Rhodobacter sp. NSM TaxID=3457501 RepID=UPI003FD6BDAA
MSRRGICKDPARRARYQAMAARGLTVAQAAAAEGVTVTTAYAYARRWGISFKFGGRQIRLSRAAFAAAWADRSIPVEAIARRFGISGASYVSTLARQMGLPRRPSGPPVLYDAAEFRSMWLAGVRREDMAAVLSLHRNAVTEEARRLGLPMRGKGWTGSITLEVYRELRLAEAMAAEAVGTRAAMGLCEMVDRIAGRPRKAETSRRVA